MINHYGHLENRDLINDPGLIIMIEAITYCQTNLDEYVRYGTLKKLCDDKINVATNGLRPTLGGTFENELKKLANPETPPERRFLTRERSPYTKKNSRIYPNIKLIMEHLSKVLNKKQRQIENNEMNYDVVVVRRYRGHREGVKIEEVLWKPEVRRNGKIIN